MGPRHPETASCRALVLVAPASFAAAPGHLGSRQRKLPKTLFVNGILLKTYRVPC